MVTLRCCCFFFLPVSSASCATYESHLGYHVVIIWKLWDKFSFVFFCALHKLRFDSWHNVHETWMRAYYPPVLPWIRLVHCIMNKLQAKYLSLFSVPIESCQTYHSDYWFLCARAVLIMRMLYMLFIFKVIAVYFKTICNSIFHKPTLSIPVSLPHSPFIPFSLSFSHTFPSSSQSQNTLQHM